MFAKNYQSRSNGMSVIHVPLICLMAIIRWKQYVFGDALDETVRLEMHVSAGGSEGSQPCFVYFS